MSRRRTPPKRPVIADYKYNSVVVTKFINSMFRDGKKSVGEHHFYKAMDIIRERSNDDELKIFLKALDNVKPHLEVRSRRVGGSTYQVPVEVRWERRQALAVRWIIQYARARSEKSMAEKLAGELMEAYNNRGTSVKKRDDTHKMAEANRAFAHYRW